MRTFIFLPPVRKAAGGVTVLRQVGEILHASGKEVFMVQRDARSWKPEGLADCAPCISWDQLHLSAQDIWLVPEGWVNALAPGLAAKARCVSYVQNWAYLFSALPPETCWKQLPVEFIAVSAPVGQFVSETTGRPAPVMRPGIDHTIFHAPKAKPSGQLTIATMPRKNRALGKQIRDIFESRNGRGSVRWLEIDGMDAYGVADALRSAHVFLMTGFPEGCPLPPLEAMACGCLPVGFSGFGGWDYMRQAQSEPRFMPWWSLREVPWGGNGLWSADGDVLDAALNLETAVRWFMGGAPELPETLRNAAMTAKAYSPENQRKEVLAVWEALES